ncbi:MAG: hypothetical protein Q9216_001919 [Gyalolechia sp. 2 TL-2023]
MDAIPYHPGIFLVPVIALLILYKVINLLRYIVQARRTGLPWLFTWTLETETIGYGKGWPPWCRLMIKDWSFEDKRRAHDEYGQVFLAVSPEGIICYACDVAMGWDVMNRRNEFTNPRDKHKLLEIYGPNVTTTEGPTFRFHLRITAPPFADSTGANDLVWHETKVQTRRLVSAWLKRSSSSTQLDINGMTLAVIAKAGFGRDLEWNKDALNASANAILTGHTISFLDAMTTTMVNMIPVLLLPRWIMYMSPLRQAAIAHKEFETYVRDMIRSEKDKLLDSEIGDGKESGSARGNLLTSVLRASADEAMSGGKLENTNAASTKKQAFTETEVMGNLFLYLLAGYETTANAILYGLICLALYPEIQDRVVEEVDRVYAEAFAQGRTELTYADDFEKFEYTYGFMYETFRLFPAPQQITKTVTRPTHVYLTTPQGPKPVLLPPECRVYLNVPATHHTEEYWPNAHMLDPTRWIRPSAFTKASGAASSASGNNPSTIDRPRGTFLTFSDGARACLGRKFAQSEYVAFIVTLLGEYRVKLKGGEVKEEVERKIFSRCKGTLTLAPGDHVGLELQKR